MTDRATLETILERLQGIPEAVRQTLSDHQWSTIPLFENEYLYLPSVAAGQSVKVQPRTTNIFKVETIVATLASGATGLVQLSDLVIPVQSGLTVITSSSMLLSETDTRSLLVAGTTGPALLWLSGQMLPPFGRLT